MDNDKIYIINGRRFRLKSEFILKDWDAAKRIDTFFGKMKTGDDEFHFINEVTQDEFIQFMYDILVPVNDGISIYEDTAGPEFFRTVDMTQAMEIFGDFFFIYLESSIASSRYLTKLQNKMTEFISKSKDSKTS